MRKGIFTFSLFSTHWKTNCKCNCTNICICYRIKPPGFMYTFSLNSSIFSSSVQLHFTSPFCEIHNNHWINCKGVHMRTHLQTRFTVSDVCVCVQGLVYQKHDARSWLELNCQAASDEVCSSKGLKCVCEVPAPLRNGVVSFLGQLTQPDRPKPPSRCSCIRSALECSACKLPV